MEKSAWNNLFQSRRGLWNSACGLKNCLRKSMVMKNDVIFSLSSFFKKGSTSSKWKQSHSYQRGLNQGACQRCLDAVRIPTILSFSKSLLRMIQMLRRRDWGTLYQKASHVNMLVIQILNLTSYSATSVYCSKTYA